MKSVGLLLSTACLFFSVTSHATDECGSDLLPHRSFLNGVISDIKFPVLVEVVETGPENFRFFAQDDPSVLVSAFEHGRGLALGLFAHTVASVRIDLPNGSYILGNAHDDYSGSNSIQFKFQLVPPPANFQLVSGAFTERNAAIIVGIPSGDPVQNETAFRFYVESEGKELRLVDPWVVAQPGRLARAMASRAQIRLSDGRVLQLSRRYASENDDYLITVATLLK